MLRKLIYVLLILVIALSIYNYYKLYNNYKPVLSEKIQPPVKIAARVGGYTIDVIDGWTAPYNEVSLSAGTVIRKTMADDKGFFTFYFIPIMDNLAEFCLVALDINLIPTYPLCVPSPPKNMNLEIHDLLLAPSLTIESAQIPAGKTTKASGATYPNSKVDVYLFTEDNNFKFLIKTIYATGLPKYQVKSNQNGYFEFSLPASSPSQNRLFAVAGFPAKGQSQKSNTLFFQTLGLWGMIKLLIGQMLLNAWRFYLALRQNPLTIIWLELGILLGLVLLSSVAISHKSS